MSQARHSWLAFKRREFEWDSDVGLDLYFADVNVERYTDSPQRVDSSVVARVNAVGINESHSASGSRVVGYEGLKRSYADAARA